MDVVRRIELDAQRLKTQFSRVFSQRLNLPSKPFIFMKQINLYHFLGLAIMFASSVISMALIAIVLFWIGTDSDAFFAVSGSWTWERDFFHHHQLRIYSSAASAINTVRAAPQCCLTVSERFFLLSFLLWCCHCNTLIHCGSKLS